MDDPNERPLYVDGFALEIAEEVVRLLDGAVKRHKEAGGTADGADLRRLRGAVREAVLLTASEVVAEQLGERTLTGSGDDAGLRRNFPAAYTKRIR